MFCVGGKRDGPWVPNKCYTSVLLGLMSSCMNKLSTVFPYCSLPSLSWMRYLPGHIVRWTEKQISNLTFFGQTLPLPVTRSWSVVMPVLTGGTKFKSTGEQDQESSPVPLGPEQTCWGLRFCRVLLMGMSHCLVISYLYPEGWTKNQLTHGDKGVSTKINLV